LIPGRRERLRNGHDNQLWVHQLHPHHHRRRPTNYRNVSREGHTWITLFVRPHRGLNLFITRIVLPLLTIPEDGHLCNWHRASSSSKKLDIHSDPGERTWVGVMPPRAWVNEPTINRSEFGYDKLAAVPAEIATAKAPAVANCCTGFGGERATTCFGWVGESTASTSTTFLVVARAALANFLDNETAFFWFLQQVALWLI
jgi:hypothetical protein